jgi:hypothetical protein
MCSFALQLTTPRSHYSLGPLHCIALHLRPPNAVLLLHLHSEGTMFLLSPTVLNAQKNIKVN